MPCRAADLMRMQALLQTCTQMKMGICPAGRGTAIASATAMAVGVAQLAPGQQARCAIAAYRLMAPTALVGYQLSCRHHCTSGLPRPSRRHLAPRTTSPNPAEARASATAAAAAAALGAVCFATRCDCAARTWLQLVLSPSTHQQTARRWRRSTTSRSRPQVSWALAETRAGKCGRRGCLRCRRWRRSRAAGRTLRWRATTCALSRTSTWWLCDEPWPQAVPCLPCAFPFGCGAPCKHTKTRTTKLHKSTALMFGDVRAARMDGERCLCHDVHYHFELLKQQLATAALPALSVHRPRVVALLMALATFMTSCSGMHIAVCIRQSLCSQSSRRGIGVS